MSEISVKIGDHIIFSSVWGYTVSGPVERLTDNSAFVPKEYGNKVRRVSFDVVVFSGPQSDAESLDARLTSSKARLNEEVRSANRRHRERNEKMIREAALSPTGEAGQK